MKKTVFITVLLLFSALLLAQTDISGLALGMPISAARDSLTAWGSVPSTTNANVFYGDMYGYQAEIILNADEDDNLIHWLYTIYTEDDWEWEDWFVYGVCDFHNDPGLDVDLESGYVIYLSSEIALHIYYNDIYDLVLDYRGH
jgi:hypothetical protein